MKLAVVVWVGLAVIWGSTWLAVGIGLESLPPFSFAGVRFTLAAAALLVAVWLAGRPFPRSRDDWALMGWTAFLAFFVSYAAQFWGMQFVPSGLAAVMFATVPLFTLVVAHVRLPSEPFVWTKGVGVVLGIAGVGAIFSDQFGVSDPRAVWGCVAFLVGSMTMAWAQVSIKDRGAHIDPMVMAAVQMGFAAVGLLAVGAWVDGPVWRLTWSSPAVIALVYLAIVGSALAFALFYWLLRHVDVTKTMSMMLVHPVVAILLGWIVLGETLGWRALVGTVIILSGLAAILTPPARRGVEIPRSGRSPGTMAVAWAWRVRGRRRRRRSVPGRVRR